MPLDEKTLAELKLAEARFYQQMWASEYQLNQQRAMHEAQAEYLAAWEKMLLPLAQQCENNPVQFCERVMGPDWFTPSEANTPRQVRELIEMSPEITSFFTAPVDLSKLDGKMILKRLQTFMAKPPGRKQSEQFGRALELKRAGMSIQQICRELNPGYARMKSVARRNEEERIRSGVNRREQKEKNKSHDPRNTPR